MLTHTGDSQASTFTQHYIIQLCDLWLCMHACTLSALHCSNVCMCACQPGFALEPLSISNQQSCCPKGIQQPVSYAVLHQHWQQYRLTILLASQAKARKVAKRRLQERVRAVHQQPLLLQSRATRIRTILMLHTPQN